jgi:hypothetical protein
MDLEMWKLSPAPTPSPEAWWEVTEAIDARPPGQEESENIAAIESALQIWPEHLRIVSAYQNNDEDDPSDCRELASMKFARNLLLNTGERWPSFLLEEPEQFAHITRVTIAEMYSYHESVDFLARLGNIDKVVIIAPTLIETLDVLGDLPSLAHVALTDYIEITPEDGGLDWLTKLEKLETLVLFENLFTQGPGWTLEDARLAKIRRLWLPLKVLLAHPAEVASELTTVTTQVNSGEDMEHLIQWVNRMRRAPETLKVLTNQRDLANFPAPEEGWSSLLPAETSLELLSRLDFTKLWESEVANLGERARG